MSDIMTAQAEQLRTLALNEEQAIETARHQLDAAIARRDRFLAAADLLDPGPQIPTLAETIEQRDTSLDYVAKVGGRRAGAGRPTLYDWAEVAQVARQAQADGVTMLSAVCAHFEVPAETGKSLIKRAREHGEDIPKVRAAPVTPQVELLLRCETCPVTYQPHEVRAMVIHASAAHHRRIFDIERKPRPVEVAS